MSTEQADRFEDEPFNQPSMSLLERSEELTSLSLAAIDAYSALGMLLHCPDLDMENMEADTIFAIETAASAREAIEEQAIEMCLAHGQPLRQDEITKNWTSAITNDAFPTEGEAAVYTIAILLS